MGKGWLTAALLMALSAGVLGNSRAAPAAGEGLAGPMREEAAVLEGEVAAVGEGSLLLWTPKGECRLALAPGAAVALNGVPVAAEALRPVTERDRVEVRTFLDRAGRAVRVEGFYRVEEVQLLAWDPGRGRVQVAPLETRPLEEGAGSAARSGVRILSGQAQIERAAHTLSWTEAARAGLSAGAPALLIWNRSGEIKKIVLAESGTLEDLWGTGTNNTGDKLEKEKRGGRAEDAGR
ncbi:MAG: hypothetical protein QJR13_08805 [Bacillota bacterium]|nr:hypothetical protein [Bacillota bacterium]